MQETQNGHRGIGPLGYTRSDDRIFEDVCETLTRDGELDARYLRVAVRGGHVVLSGRVADRDAKYLAEDLAASVAGVVDVDNRLKIERGARPYDPELEHTIYGRLVEEHRMVAAMLDIVTTTRPDETRERLDAWRTVAAEILAHTRAEDRVLYHELDGSYELDDAIDDARGDHRKVEALIREIDAIGDGGDEWLARVKTVKAAIEAHVRFEEDVMLPHAHNVLDTQHATRLLEFYDYERASELRRLRGLPAEATEEQPVAPGDIAGGGTHPPRVAVAPEAHKVK